MNIAESLGFKRYEKIHDMEKSGELVWISFLFQLEKIWKCGVIRHYIQLRILFNFHLATLWRKLVVDPFRPTMIRTPCSRSLHVVLSGGETMGPQHCREPGTRPMSWADGAGRLRLAGGAGPAASGNNDIVCRGRNEKWQLTVVLLSSIKMSLGASHYTAIAPSLLRPPSPGRQNLPPDTIGSTLYALWRRYYASPPPPRAPVPRRPTF